MHLEINQLTQINDNPNGIATCVGRNIAGHWESSAITPGDTTLTVYMAYFVDATFGASVNWDKSKSLNVFRGETVDTVMHQYEFELTEAEVAAGITQTLIYTLVKNEMVSHGKTDGNLVIVS